MKYSERNEYFEKCDKEFQRILIRFGIAQPPCHSGVGLGWLPVVEKAFEKMIDAGWDKDLHQVKQKFCGLRIYIGEGEYRKTGKIGKLGEDIQEETEIGLIINAAESECDKLCEVCGREREKKGMGSGWALCNECIENGDF